MIQADKTAKDILVKLKQLKTFRNPYEADWKLITKFMAPGLNFWDEITTKSVTSSKDVYDTTPMSAVKTLANGLQGYMVDRGTFFKINLESYKLYNRKPTGVVRAYVQNLEMLFKLIFERSNWYDEVNVMLRNGATIGTTVVYPEEVVGENEIIFHTIHPKEVWIQENRYKKVDTVFREFKMTYRDLMDRWDVNDPTLIKNNEKTPYGECTVVHAVFPRTDRDVEKIDNKNKKYASIWVLKDREYTLEESGFDDMPYVVWRWSTEHGGVYGRAPAHDALYDALRANVLNKTLLDVAQESAHPALNVPQEKMDSVDLSPRAMNAYADPSRIIAPIQTVGSYPIARDREEALENIIKDHFYVDMFLMLNNQSSQQKTATEVLEMQSEKATVLRPTTARIESELFDGIFDLLFALADKAGWLPPVPPEISQMLQGEKISIDYDNLIEYLSERHRESQTTDIVINKLIALSQYDPTILDNINLDNYAIHELDGSTLPADIIRTEREKRQMRSARAQAQQQQQDSENLQKQASAMKDLGDTNTENVSQMMGAAGAQ